MSTESKEFVRMRADAFAMAAHQAARHITGTCLDGAAPSSLREAMADASDDTKRKRCICCQEWRQIRIMAHVCDECAEMGGE
jgi:hypothetical protein